MLKKKKKEDIENNHDPLTDEMPATEGNEVETDEETPEQLLKQEVALANDKYLRLYAEFDNFRRRTTKERAELLQTAGKDVIVSLLPVLDDFERAIRSMENTKDVNSVKEGVVLIQQKLKNILGQKGLKEMQSIGNAFDPELHEAITNVPVAEDQKGKVIDEVEKGYYLNDKVARFAKVVVGN
ncbi:MAG TPA: nucleotide exchange factor GrpE [Mucilaginibacter sp.]|nr:nucleotide exchange factor GrpE [Mucilaginibacter sp.]